MQADRPGRFSDGRSAASRPVMVRVLSTGVEIRGEDGFLVAVWHTEDLIADGALPGAKGVRLRCNAEPDARLVVEDAYFITQSLPEVARVPRSRRRGWRGLVLGLLLGTGVLIGLAVSLPDAARLAVGLVPPAMERAWGSEIASGLESQMGRCRGMAGQSALNGLMERLAAGLPPERRIVRARVLPTATVNALALPGGEIVVFRGLIDQAEGPDELAGVLAHELTHVGERHPTAALLRGMGIGVLATLVTGDASGAVASIAAGLMAATYSREDEAEADRGALVLLAGAGIGPEGLAAFFHRQERAGGAMPAWLDSHPEPGRRAAAVEAARPSHPRPPALRDDEWQAIKAMCGGAL